MNFEIVENIKEISRDFVSNLDKICSKKDFFKKIKKFIFFSKKGLTKYHPYAIIVHVDETKRRYLGVAQLVARYLGVVEAASSSLVTQTISSVHNRFKLWTLDIFLLMLTFRLKIELF